MSKKLQIFVSSTFKDLVRERQKAVEGILKSRHIPAGMELFVPTDKTQWNIIQEWIKDSDVLLLILGGRYGSIEPQSRKSYTHLEYEFALENNIPVISIVLSDQFLANKKSANINIEIYEHEVIDPAIQQYKLFKQMVMSNYVEIVENIDQISTGVTLALNYFMERDSVEYQFRGWIRGSEKKDSSIYEWKTNINKYLDEKKRIGLAYKTIEGYSIDLRILGEYFETHNLNIAQVDNQAMQNFFIYRETAYNVKKRSSLEKTRGILHAFFEWLIEFHIINENPMKHIKNYRYFMKDKDILNYKEIELLRVNANSKRDRALIEILLSTGCKLSEISNIKISDIDWANKTITLTNSRGEKRITFLTPIAEESLSKYLRTRKDSLDYLIITERMPYRKLSNSGIQTQIRELAKQSNVTRTISPRTFRNTFTTLLEERNIPLNVIESILGYHPRKNRAEIYTNITKGNIWSIFKERPDF